MIRVRFIGGPRDGERTQVPLTALAALWPPYALASRDPDGTDVLSIHPPSGPVPPSLLPPELR